ncbi:MAG: hypothetical protein ACKVQU_13210 [Burkholderiales bacterium]
MALCVASVFFAFLQLAHAGDASPMHVAPATAPDERAALTLSQSVIDREISDFTFRASEA